MRLRTQLVLAFFLLAVVPMAAIVLYSYATSERAFRRAVEAETRTLAAEIGERMEGIREEMHRLVEDLGRLPVQLLVAQHGSRDPAEIYSELVESMGEIATFVEWFELTPANRPTTVPASLRSAEPLLSEALFIFPSEALASALRKMERYRDLGPEAAAAIRDSVEATLGEAIRRESDIPPEELSALRSSAARYRSILGNEFRSPVGDEESPVGYLTIHVRPGPVLRRTLDRIHRSEGDVPYILDAEGTLYVSDIADRQRLGEPQALAGPDSFSLTPSLGDDWIVVETPDPGSGLLFGYARPVRSSLREMRTTAARNFGAGLLVVVLALAAITLISGRLTRDLGIVTASAERLASGDLMVRLPKLAGREMGQLARTFNRMAFELSEKERRLLEEERLRKEQEIRQRLLAAENESKSRELEEARQLQLSLLPRRLPRVAGVDLATLMDTATEVGGDYYDFFAGQDGSLTVAIGDATGHGARAGTMVAMVKGLLSLAAPDEDLAAVLSRANGVLHGMELGRMSMALSLVRLKGGCLTVAAAGMPPVLLRRYCASSSSDEIEEIALAGIPLGALARSRYEEWRTDIAPGDSLLLMSDGFPELLDGNDEPLGYARARRLFAEVADLETVDIVDRLAAACRRFRNGRPLADDVTFVALRATETSRLHSS